MLKKLFIFLIFGLFNVSATYANEKFTVKQWEPLILLAAERIDSLFRDVARSTSAIGDEYAAIHQDNLAVTAEDRSYWLNKQEILDKTTAFQSHAQIDHPAFFRYGSGGLNDQNIQQLKLFDYLSPVFRAAYKSFDFSWVYLTTADDMFMIYPYLSLEEASNNYLPTQQVFYLAADFDKHKVGWTEPYLDLAGEGMMITASYPIYSTGRLLGVASRDITLKNLSRSVLNHLANDAGSSAFIIDKNGMVIDASQSQYENELQSVNNKKGKAALYYRTSEGLKNLGIKDIVTSEFPRINKLMEQAISEFNGVATDSTVHIMQNGQEALIAEIKTTGWLVVMVKN